MKQQFSLYTAARRFLMEREQQLRGRMSDDAGDWQTLSAMELRVRRNRVCDLLTEVERNIPHPDLPVNEVRAILLRIAREAPDRFEAYGFVERPSMPEWEVSEDALGVDERNRFEDFLFWFNPDGAYPVEPLPYRRTLSTEEAGTVWQRLVEDWGLFGFTWYPDACEEQYEPTDAYFFDAAAFERLGGVAALRRALRDGRVVRCWEIREEGPSCELDVELLQPTVRDMTTGFWSSSRLDWLVYAGMGNTVTVSGRWLVDALISTWPEWLDAVWMPGGMA